MEKFQYYTEDSRYIVKTISKEKAEFFLHILKDYAQYIKKHKGDTFILR